MGINFSLSGNEKKSHLIYVLWKYSKRKFLKLRLGANFFVRILRTLRSQLSCFVTKQKKKKHTKSLVYPFFKKHYQFDVFDDDGKRKVNTAAKNSMENGSRRLGFIYIAMTISTI